MSEQAFWAVAWAFVGFFVGVIVCHLIFERYAEECFDAGFRIGRSFDGFDDWFRENFGDRYAD